MVVVRFRSSEDAEHVTKKLKKMKMFINELIECMEDKYEEDDYDDEVEYREQEAMYRKGGSSSSGTRYRYRGGRM